MYEGLGSQFFRTTTAIESRSNAFDKSRLVMTYLTNLGVIGILCSLRLVLEELSANNFSLSNAEGKISGLLNRRSIVDLVDLDLSNDHKDCPNLHKNS